MRRPWVGQPHIFDNQKHDSEIEFSMKIVFVLSASHRIMQSGTPNEHATGVYLSELARLFLPLQKFNHDIVVCTPGGNVARLDEESIKSPDAESQEFLKNWWNADVFKRPTPLGQVSYREVEAIVIPGGHGPMYDLAGDKSLIQLIEKVWEHGGIVAAVCHGPAALVNVQFKSPELPGQAKKWLVDGRRVTGFSNQEERQVEMTKELPFSLEHELVLRGGHYSKAAEAWASHVVVDEHLLTGQNPASAKPLADAVIEALKTRRAKHARHEE